MPYVLLAGAVFLGIFLKIRSFKKSEQKRLEREEEYDESFCSI